jgi:hypothetical protein
MEDNTKVEMIDGTKVPKESIELLEQEMKKEMCILPPKRNGEQEYGFMNPCKIRPNNDG